MSDQTFETETQSLTAEEIEAAYERALSAMDSVEVAVEDLSATATAEALNDEDAASEQCSDSHEAVAHDDADGRETAPHNPHQPPLHPREVIEAALFVGGQSLTTRRLSQLFGDRETPERIDQHIAELNALYQQEARPYQIDFGEGGYRLVLRPEFEPVRNAVFGTGPREVKLSQDALEVLAFVAYRQPATVDDLEEAGKQTAGSLLRQLLRRQLISLERSEDGTVSYTTTQRFLEVFGLRSLDDLPFPEDLELK